MKKWLKITLWVLISIVGIGVIGLGGCVGCVRIIGNSNSCYMFNIDNIELRAHIDIPSIESGKCSCILDKEDDSKINYFKIRTDEVNMDRYIERNSFVPINETDIDLSVFGKLSKTPEITPDNIQGYYYNSGYNPGKGKRTHWLAIVDKNSGDLWVYMKYKEVQPDSVVKKRM